MLCSFVHNYTTDKCSFFEGKAFQPILTTQQVERVQNLVESANKNKIDLIWLQAVFQLEKVETTGRNHYQGRFQLLT